MVNPKLIIDSAVRIQAINVRSAAKTVRVPARAVRSGGAPPLTSDPGPSLMPIQAPWGAAGLSPTTAHPNTAPPDGRTMMWGVVNDTAVNGSSDRRPDAA